MSMRKTDAALLTRMAAAEQPQICVGQLVDIDQAGVPIVDFPGNTRGPLRARTLVQTADLPDVPEYQTVPVMIAFENRDARLPIILGLIRDRIVGGDGEPSVQTRLTGGLVDGKQVVFEAENEIVLKCGKSSITLQRNGKIVIRGVDVTSRASQANKLKGANVRIN